MKKAIFIFAVAITIALSIFAAQKFYSPSAEAQKKYPIQWEYAAITYAAIPANTENQAVITAITNVCYLQPSGCLNEEVKAELIYAKFVQESRLENTSYSKSLAYNRAKDLAFAKTVAKLGLEGWELVVQPPFSFDAYIPDGQGATTIVSGGKETKPNVYFKRLVQ